MAPLRFLLAAGLLAIAFLPVCAQEPADTLAQNDAFPSSREWRSTIDPDAPLLQLSKFGGRWRNRIGMPIELVSGRLFSGHASLAIDPFIEIHDFTPKNYFSWELWRGSAGVTGTWGFRFGDSLLPAFSKHAVVELGWHHESDHASSPYYVDTFTQYYDFKDFSNGSFGSFEYIKAKAHLLATTHDGIWSFHAALLWKTFPTPIIDKSVPEWDKGGRGQRSAYGIEGAARIRLFSYFHLGIAGYFETIKTDFDPYRNYFYRDALSFLDQSRDHSEDGNNINLIYRMAEIGLEYTLPQGFRIMPYLSYSNSHGRGLDFTRQYTDYGWGVKVRL